MRKLLWKGCLKNKIGDEKECIDYFLLSAKRRKLRPALRRIGSGGKKYGLLVKVTGAADKETGTDGISDSLSTARVDSFISRTATSPIVRQQYDNHLLCQSRQPGYGVIDHADYPDRESDFGLDGF